MKTRKPGKSNLEVSALGLPTCEALGIGFVPWSPLGQGFLTGSVNATMTFDSNSDLRASFPRFAPEARKADQPAINLVKSI